jgi:hypothetical protein
VLRFVALEGGGEAFTAMHANYVQVVSGDASEATLYASGNTRVLAVLSEQRLPGVLANVPTAREQGVDVVWPSSAACGWGRRCRTRTIALGRGVRPCAGQPQFAADARRPGCIPLG